MDINKIVQGIYNNLEGNNFVTLGLPDISMWQEPLIGIAAGDDPYFLKLKEHIGKFHWTPAEAFALKYGNDIAPSNLRVISMAFPQSKEAKTDQRSAKVFPCDKWLVSRGEWEPLMQVFSGRLVATLENLGIRAVSIDLQKEFHLEKSPNLGIASTWSHRHAAYAAGLGTFGLTDAIITEKGTAVRITSLIVEAPLDITPRTYDAPYDWCLHYQGKKCGLCVPRCPADALDLYEKTSGHNKDKCAEYEDYALDNLYPEHITRGDYIFGCGICQVAIPCQNKKP